MIELRINNNAAAKSLCDFLTHRETETYSITVEVSILHYLCERLEEPIHLIWSHTYSWILDWYVSDLFLIISFYFNFNASSLSIFDSIWQEVNYNLSKPIFICDDNNIYVTSKNVKIQSNAFLISFESQNI